MSERVPTEAVAESIKMAFDSFKHLSTLNAGSIVLIGTFMKDIFPSDNGTLDVGLGIKLLIGASFVFFGVSLALAVYVMNRCMSILEKYIYSPLEVYRGESTRTGLRVTVLPLWAFWIGLVLFGAAVLITL